MSVDEARRHRLYEAVRRTIGDEEAATLMEHLPPQGWSDIATRADLIALRSDLERVEAVMRADLSTTKAELSGELQRELRSQMKWLVVLMAPTWISCIALALRAS